MRFLPFSPTPVDGWGRYVASGTTGYIGQTPFGESVAWTWMPEAGTYWIHPTFERLLKRYDDTPKEPIMQASVDATGHIILSGDGRWEIAPSVEMGVLVIYGYRGQTVDPEQEPDAFLEVPL